MHEHDEGASQALRRKLLERNYGRLAAGDAVLGVPYLRERALATVERWRALLEGALVDPRPGVPSLDRRLAWCWILLPEEGERLFTSTGPAPELLERVVAREADVRYRQVLQHCLQVWSWERPEEWPHVARTVEAPLADDGHLALSDVSDSLEANVLVEWDFLMRRGTHYELADEVNARRHGIEPGTLLLTEVGMWVALMRSGKPTGRRLRKFLVDAVAPEEGAAAPAPEAG